MYLQLSKMLVIINNLKPEVEMTNHPSFLITHKYLIVVTWVKTEWLVSHFMNTNPYKNIVGIKISFLIMMILVREQLFLSWNDIPQIFEKVKIFNSLPLFFF